MDKIGKMERLPGDLLAATVLVVATLLFALLPPLSYTPVRIPLGLLMVLFVPGYTLIAALFPRNGDLDGIERVALSFGLSIAVVPLMGLGLNYTPWGIRLTPVVISISLFTLAMSAVAYLRRMSLPPHQRFSVKFRKSLNLARAELMADEKGRLDKALTIILILSIILSVTALVYVIVTPKQGEKFTEFYILGPKGKAYDYPTKVVAGNKSMVIVGVVNHEYSTVNYTMNLNFDNSTILNRKMTLEHNQTWEHPVTYDLSHTGDEQKLEFLLYKEDNFTAPYRDLHLWVNVSSSEEPSARAFESGFTGSAANAVIRAGPVTEISPISSSLEGGSGGDGGEGNGLRSTESKEPLMLKQEPIVERNRSNETQTGNISLPSIASGRQNTTPLMKNITIKPAENASVNKSNEGNISKAIAVRNESNNPTGGSEFQSMKAEAQARNRGNIAPIQLSNTTHKQTYVIGSKNSSQKTSLG